MGYGKSDCIQCAPKVTLLNGMNISVGEAKGNVSIHKGLFLALPSGHVIVITIYTFLSMR